MNVGHMEEFVELSHDLNFTMAAKRLHITQPALSNHVQTLERECGAVLIERGGRFKPRLTPAGQRFLDLCVNVLDAYACGMRAVREAGCEISGRIVVRMPRNEYSYPLVDYLFEFRKAHPSIDVAMLPWVPVDGIEDVLSGTVDIAYVGHGEGTHAFDRGTLELVPYCHTQLFLWAEEDVPCAAAGSLAPADLAGMSVLIPANEKHDSWVLGLEHIRERCDVAFRVEERYCDSIEDLVMSKAQPVDVMLCDENTLKFAAFRLRGHHRAVPFSPPVYVPVSLGYDAETHNQALLELVAFLQAKGAGEDG